MKRVTEKQLRQVTVLVRYFIKATQAVVLYVENDNGKRYYVRLQENGVNTCNCKATKECYHIKASLNSEQARKFAAKRLPMWAVELVAKGIVVAPKQVVETVALAVVSPKVTDISTRGNLNGSRAFSLLRVG